MVKIVKKVDQSYSNDQIRLPRMKHKIWTEKYSSISTFVEGLGVQYEFCVESGN